MQRPSPDKPWCSCVGDVYLYSDEIESRFTFAYVYGTRGLASYFASDHAIFVTAFDAFRCGASSVEIRPLKELEGGSKGVNCGN